MRRSVLALLATLPLLAGCNLRNAESLATAGVAVAGVTAIGFTVDSLVNSAAQRRQQEQQFQLQAENQRYFQEEGRASRTFQERMQIEQLEIQKDQLRRMR